jgi:predicted component of type VI protein secretion system
MTIGRGAGCDLQLPEDAQVSRVHAQLERVGPDWTLIDDGLSRNGTYVNGQRISGRRRLRDGDIVLIGATSLTYRAFRGPVSQATLVAGEMLAAVTSLSDTQRQVLLALCRPFRDGAPYATPATNQQIGAELYLSVDAVKTHLRTLFQKVHIEDLPQNQKRAKLVERAFALGIVSRREL